VCEAQDPAAGKREHLTAELSRVRSARSRLIEAYQEGFMELGELRQRIPKLRQRELALQGQVEALDVQAADAERHVQLSENLESFLESLHASSQTLSIPDRQRVLRLVVKQVEIGSDTVVIKHSIPVSGTDPPGDYLLRGRRHFSSPRQHRSPWPRKSSACILSESEL